MQINAHIDDIIDNDIIDMVIKHAIQARPHDFPSQSDDLKSNSGF